jgi:hypothetical protein
MKRVMLKIDKHLVILIILIVLFAFPVVTTSTEMKGFGNIDDHIPNAHHVLRLAPRPGIQLRLQDILVYCPLNFKH